MTHPDTKPEALLPGGMDNKELREAWGRKLPGVEPTDRDLTAFALGVEVGYAGKSVYFNERNSARDAWRRAATERDRLHAECESLRTQLQEQALQSLSTMGQDDATIADLRAQLAEARAEAEALTTALAACRDVFPLIEPGDPNELEWLDAVAFPGAVPAYVKAKAEALRADARRYAEAMNMARICAESHHKRADDCGDLARKLLTALNAIDTAMGAKEA